MLAGGDFVQNLEESARTLSVTLVRKKRPELPAIRQQRLQRWGRERAVRLATVNRLGVCNCINHRCQGEIFLYPALAWSSLPVPHHASRLTRRVAFRKKTRNLCAYLPKPIRTLLDTQQDKLRQAKLTRYFITAICTVKHIPRFQA